MLPRKHRLTKKKDFKEIYKKGGAIFGPSLSLRFKRKKQINFINKENSRFGFVVSNKIFKTNVARNHLKRQLRSMVRNKLNQISSGFDYVIIARPQIKERSYQKTEKDLEKLFKKAKVYPK